MLDEGKDAFFIAGDKVLEAVPINVHTGHGVGLADADAVGVVPGFVRQDVVLFEEDFTRLLNLFIPSDTVAMCIEGGHDIVVAITIYVVGKHLGKGYGCGVGFVSQVWISVIGMWISGISELETQVVMKYRKLELP